MTDKIVVVDFAGTLVTTEAIRKANEFRSKILQRAIPTDEEHAHSELLYKGNNEAVARLTGLESDMQISYRAIDLGIGFVTGEEMQTIVATNLFQVGMYMAAKELGHKMYQEGFIDELVRIREAGYKLAIVSGVRQEIVSGVLAITGCTVPFDFIYGQPPNLGVSNYANMLLTSKGNIAYVIGDKMSDLSDAPDSAETIFVKWGDSKGGEEEFAGHSISKPRELRDIIK